MLFYKGDAAEDPFHPIYSDSKWLYPYEGPVRDFPFILDLETTNHCNLDCVFCSRQLITSKLGRIATDTFRRIVDEAAAHGAAVRLNGWGEPFIHTEIVEQIRYAHARGCLTMIYTNGTLLTEAKAEALIEAGLDEMKFSMQGLNKHQYEEMREGATYEKFRGQVKLMHEVRERRGARRPFITLLTSVITKDWLEETPEAYRDEWFAYVDKLAIDHTVFTFVEELARVKKYLPYHAVERTYVPCANIAIMLSLNWKGDILICNQDYDADPHYVLGNLRDMTIHEAWHSPKMNAQREAVGRGLRHAEFRLCRVCYPNTKKYDGLKVALREPGKR